LHLLAPVSTVGLALVVAAIVVQEGLSATGAKTILAGALLFLMGPIVTHMTARARWHGGRHGGAAQVKKRELEK
jgi:multicomponent Na+:H+ antiporter subunit G